MKIRFLWAALIAAALCSTGLKATLFAQTLPVPQDSPTAAPVKKVAFVTKTYAVLDLVAPVDRSPLSINLARRAAAVSTVSTSSAPAAKCAVCRHQQAAPGAKAVVPSGTEEAKLIDLITSTISPKSWKVNGGEGTLDFFPLGMSLVIHQTPDIQEQVLEMLSALRRFQETCPEPNQEIQIAIEFRVIKVSDASMARLGMDHGTKDGQEKCAAECQECTAGKTQSNCTTNSVDPGVTFLTAEQVRAFLTTVQSDKSTNIMLAPKVTLFNGQRSSLKIAHEQFFVTGIERTQVNGESVALPHNEPVTTGMQMSLQPLLSADRRLLQVRVDGKVAELASPTVPLFPITTYVTPVFEGGATGKPVPFSQFIQQPKLNTIIVDKTMTVPNGSTALLRCGKWIREVKNETKTPILGEIPYLESFFTNVSYHNETENILFMVTPRIIIDEEHGTPAATGVQRAVYSSPVTPPVSAAPGALPPVPYILKQAAYEKEEAGCLDLEPSDTELSRLIYLYNVACAKGMRPEATQLAVQALAIDPTCFSKHGTNR